MKRRRPLFTSPLPPVEISPDKSSRPPVGFYFLAALLLLAITAGAWQTIADSMLLLHLKAGEGILRNYQVPVRDMFSAGSFAEFWVFFEWSWSAILAQVFKLGEWTGLALLNVFCVALTAILMVTRARRHGGRWFESMVVTGTVLAALLPGYQPSAAAFAMLLWLVSLKLFEAERLWPMVFLPVVAIFWANAHPAFLLAILLPLARLIFPPPSHNPQLLRSPSFYLFVIIVGCILGSFVTPHSLDIVRALLATATVSIHESMSHWATVYTEPWTICRIVIAIALIVTILLNRRAIYGWQIAVTFVLITSSLLSPLALNFLLVFLAAPASRSLSQLLASTWQVHIVRNAAATALVLLVIAVSTVTLASSGFRKKDFGTGIRADVFPETAAGRLASLPLRNTILNDPEDGGYIAWRTWPMWKITADQRPTLYDVEFRDNYEKLWEGGAGWEQMLNYWRVWVVLGSPEVMEKHPNNNLYYRLAESPDWIPVWWDSASILYMKTDADLSTSNLQPFRQLKPGLSWSALAARMESPGQWRELAADLRRVTMEDRTNLVAQEYLQRAESEVDRLR